MNNKKNDIFPNFTQNLKFYEKRQDMQIKELEKFISILKKKMDHETEQQKQYQQLIKEVDDFYVKSEKAGWNGSLRVRMEELKNNWNEQQLECINTVSITKILEANQESLRKIKDTAKQFLGQRRKDCERYDKELKTNLSVIQSAQQDYRTFMQVYSKKDYEQRKTFEDLRAENMRTLQINYQEYNNKLDNLFDKYNAQEDWFHQQEKQIQQKVDDNIIDSMCEKENKMQREYNNRQMRKQQYQQSIGNEAIREKYVDKLVDQKHVLQRLEVQQWIESVSKDMGLKTEDSFQSKQQGIRKSQIQEGTDKLKEQKSFSTAKIGQKSGEEEEIIEEEDYGKTFVGFSNTNEKVEPFANLCQNNNQFLPIQNTNGKDTVIDFDRFSEYNSHKEEQRQFQQQQQINQGSGIEGREIEIRDNVQRLFVEKMSSQEMVRMQKLISFNSISTVLDCIIHFQELDGFFDEHIFSQLGFILQYILLFVQQNIQLATTLDSAHTAIVEQVIRLVKTSKLLSNIKTNKNVFEIYISQDLKFDLEIYRLYFQLKINNIYQKNYSIRESRFEDFVSFLVYLGLTYSQLQSNLDILKQKDIEIYENLMNLPKVQNIKPLLLGNTASIAHVQSVGVKKKKKKTLSTNN